MPSHVLIAHFCPVLDVRYKHCAEADKEYTTRKARGKKTAMDIHGYRMDLFVFQYPGSSFLIVNLSTGQPCEWHNVQCYSDDCKEGPMVLVDAVQSFQCMSVPWPTVVHAQTQFGQSVWHEAKCNICFCSCLEIMRHTFRKQY